MDLRNYSKQKKYDKYIINKNMKNLFDTICESAVITGLRPSFYFNNMQFFDTMTDQEEQRFITASYKRVDNNHYIYFYYKRKQIGYLKLKPITVY